MSATSPPQVRRVPTILVAYSDFEGLGIRLSRTWVRKLAAKEPPQFPRPIALTARRRAWRLDALQEWIANRPEASTSKQEVRHGHVSSP
jgi:predicted DNA-binding transcriptional regulator AlpA